MSRQKIAAAVAAVKSRDLEQLPPSLTIPQVADFLQVANSSVYDLVRQQQLASFKIGSTIRIPRKSLATFCGLDEADLSSKQQARREEVEALLARHRVAADEVSRTTARLLELGVAIAEQRTAVG